MATLLFPPQTFPSPLSCVLLPKFRASSSSPNNGYLLTGKRGFWFYLDTVRCTAQKRNQRLIYEKDFVKRRKAGQLSRINMSHTHAESEGCKHTVKDPSNQNFRLSSRVDAKITLNMNQMDKSVCHWCL